MNTALGLVTLALAIKHLVDSFKPIYEKDSGFNISMILSTVLGLAAAWSVQIDFLALIGFEPISPVVGIILTGLGLAGGSNTIFDLVNSQVKKVNVEVEEN